MITVLVQEIQFMPGGDCLWVIAASGKVLLQVRSTVGIRIAETKCINPVCHADMLTRHQVQMQISIPDDALKLPAPSDLLVTIPAGAIEFSPVGNTIWVQSPIGATILRIKSRLPLQICDPALLDLSEEDDRLFCDVEIEEEIEICLVEKISARYNLL